MRLFRYIAQFFGENVYCEDCMHCAPREDQPWDSSNAIFDRGPICKAHPITVDCSEKDTFVKRGANVKIIKAHKSCDEVRLLRSMPKTYDPTCWKFDKKPLQSENNVV